MPDVRTVPPAAAGALPALPAYLLDAAQRWLLFLDLLRQRGNDEIDMAARPTATVLRFEQEIIMRGTALPRPMNYSLSRILPPPGGVTDPAKRPVVVVDPRAGQGPGIGGFKPESEIGDALKAGHPVYFIGFSAAPEPGQQFLDVVEGQVAFFERVVALHPAAPRPFAIGNCQAGYQTLMVAMLRPDLFGPCLVAGAPMSYWQGVHGANPMRYSGGMSGGSWMTALTSDLGCGRFDGTWLVLNFDKLGPANWLWGKQYAVYADVDAGGARYLAFEKWWGDFIALNGDELQYLVDNLFIGDKLARHELTARDGTVFDLRRITSPIIVFTSAGDNISPPPQALGWVVDCYRDVADIQAFGQTIVYCMAEKIGHLALFVSSKVGAEQDEAFIRLMDVIDCLPPGLYEMVLSPRPPEMAPAGGITGDWLSRFEPRTLDDIRALGRNSPADDRAFAAVAKLSELNLSMYRAFLQPWVRLMATQRGADLSHMLNPLRLSYTMFSDRNPWMRAVPALAARAAAQRRTVAADNPLLAVQDRMSHRITAGLEAYRVARDRMTEQAFFGFYGSPLVQSFLGLPAGTEVRPPPRISAEQLAQHRREAAATAAKVAAGGGNEALIRAVLYVLGTNGAVDQRCALALGAIRRRLMGVSLAGFKTMVREQFVILALEPARAIDALPALVPDAAARRALLSRATEIVSAGEALSAAASDRLAALVKLLPVGLAREAAI
jgi:hypothetical protein